MAFSQQDSVRSSSLSQCVYIIVFFFYMFLALVVEYESHLALDGGVDGLLVVRELLCSLARDQAIFHPEGPRRVFLELAEDHPPVVEAFFARHTAGERSDGEQWSEICESFEFVSAGTDWEGHTRFVELRAL